MESKSRTPRITLATPLVCSRRVSGLAKSSSAGPEIVSPLKEIRFAGQKHRSTRNLQIQTYQTPRERFRLPETTHQKTPGCGEFHSEFARICVIYSTCPAKRVSPHSNFISLCI